MSSVLFENASIFDATGVDPFPGSVLVQDQRIRAIFRTRASTAERANPTSRYAPNGEGFDADTQRIDCRGATLMPGLIEAHAHLSFASSTGRIIRDRNLPPEEHLLITAHNAAVLLDSGYTAAYSAGSKGPRFEVALKKEIDNGYLPGPRLIPSTFERAAGADKERTGPESLRNFIAHAAADGVQSIKLLLSGDDAFGKGGSLKVEYSAEEVAAAAQAAREQGVWLAAHAQAAEAVKMAARSNFHVIYHCTHADEEALDLLEARRDDLFVAPAIGIVYAKAYLGEAFGFTKQVVADSGFIEAIEQNVVVYEKMRQRGIRVLPGGDYGFPWNPTGENARDLELFVTLFSWSEKDVLMAATHHGAQLMGMSDQIGQLREGYLADLILVEGDPLQDIRILQHRERLLAIMQDGVFRKAPPSSRLRVGAPDPVRSAA